MTQTGEVSYNLDDSPWDSRNSPREDIVFYANLYVHSGNSDKQWECSVSPAKPYYPETWHYHNGLVCTFTNLTDETCQVNSAEIFQIKNGEVTAIPFSDGNFVHKIDFSVDPDTNSDLEISKDIFPFDERETGIYKIVFNVGKQRLEQQFIIDNETEDFLTEEQMEAFDSAYEITREYFGFSPYLSQEYVESHTVDDFLSEICTAYTYDYAYETARRFGYIDENRQLRETSSDRGSDITFQSGCCMPVVLFKCFIVHGHEDYPYFIWYEEINYHMVKTPDGWRFDNFQMVN